MFWLKHEEIISNNNFRKKIISNDNSHKKIKEHIYEN